MDLDVYGLCLGGNVFGWTADRDASFAVLDAYVEAGGNFIDTADTYMRPNMGISETIIGEWMAARGNRDDAGHRHQGRLRRRPVGARTSPRTSTASLERLQTDRIDLYYAHKDDGSTCRSRRRVRAFDALVRDGQGALRRRLQPSGRAARASRWRSPSARGWPRTCALQPHYNLVERERYEREYAPIVAEHGLAVAPYYALAKGFLTGKYRRRADGRLAARAEGARAVPRRARRGACWPRSTRSRPRTTRRSRRSRSRGCCAKPGVAAPIASARTAEQLAAAAARGRAAR